MEEINNAKIKLLKEHYDNQLKQWNEQEVHENGNIIVSFLTKFLDNKYQFNKLQQRPHSDK